jgi:hypothetical protein
MSGVRFGICTALTHVRSLAFSSGGERRTWGKIGLFDGQLHFLECCEYRTGAALYRN